MIGLNAWLASVGVPDVLPRCACGWHAQTVRHVLLHCPNYREIRPSLIENTGTENLQEMLSRPKAAQATARWLIRSGVLRQFDTVKAMEQEAIEDYTPLQELDLWT